MVVVMILMVMVIMVTMMMVMVMVIMVTVMVVIVMHLASGLKQTRWCMMILMDVQMIQWMMDRSHACIAYDKNVAIPHRQSLTSLAWLHAVYVPSIMWLPNSSGSRDLKTSRGAVYNS
jgi:hypothetical protein